MALPYQYAQRRGKVKVTIHPKKIELIIDKMKHDSQMFCHLNCYIEVSHSCKCLPFRLLMLFSHWIGLIESHTLLLDNYWKVEVFFTSLSLSLKQTNLFFFLNKEKCPLHSKTNPLLKYVWLIVGINLLKLFNKGLNT